MPRSTQFIIDELKAARQKKGISQRALGQKTHIPQSHISNIEKGRVDLHLSSLLEIARALELEVMLVPSSLIMVVQTLQREKRGNNQHQIPMYQLNPDDPNG
ncbi:MAG: helix-turn-helix transcriptional regulator [Chlamydiia bacterium]|nr:helix-turn-helix transcriptional regulator [Chlamydiia bacterium]